MKIGVVRAGNIGATAAKLLASIERAKRLLRETNFTILEIAFELGFADQSHFTKIFRRLVGVAPTVFQRQNKC